MLLSSRLQANASFVSPGNILADVGTDHAYLPIDLVERGIIPSAIAMDLNEGPLCRAREHVNSVGLADRIDLRLSDGLKELRAGEADTVLIAGMGGALTVRILDMGRDVLEGVKELVLQPQSELVKLRSYLGENGWRIVDECMVFEDGKYYTLIKAVHGSMQLTELEAVYGPVLLRGRSSVFKSFLDREREILKRNLYNLEKGASDKASARKEELISRLRMNEDAEAMIKSGI